jgi:hypothetical protein
MKLSLNHLAALLLAMTACSSTEGEPARPAAPAVTTPAPTADPPAAKRTMTIAPAMGTAPDNLVFDPTFGTLGSQFGMGVMVDGVDAHVEVPATSPAGAAQRVLVARASGDRAAVILAAQGGLGEYDARVFVSVPDAAETPSVLIATTDGNGYPLTEVKGTTEHHGDRTYRLLTAHITDPLYGVVFFVAEPAGATPIVLSAPRLIASNGMAKKSSPVRATARVALGPVTWRAVTGAAARQSAPAPLVGGRFVPPEILARARQL